MTTELLLADTRGPDAAAPAPAPSAATPILGTSVHMISFAESLDLAQSWIRTRARTYICHANVHSLLTARDDPAMRAALHGAGLNGADGMPLVWIGRRRGLPAERVYGPDFMEALIRRTGAWTGAPCRHVLYGSTPEVLERLAARLRAMVPGIEIAGILSPPMGGWDEAENRRQVAALNAMDADVVWVGLGAPRQELWMARNRPRLDAPLLVGVGAAFDFLAGTKAQAPYWIRQSGLEWAFRLATEPRRLFSRYLAVVPRFAALALAEELKGCRRA